MSIIAHIKGLTRHSAIYTISTFIQRALGLIMLPVYTDTSYISTKSAYGDYALVYTFMAFMNIVYLYGMDAAFLRFFFLGKHKREDVYKTAFSAIFINGILLSAVLYIFAEPVAVVVFSAKGYAFFIQITAGILFFDTLCNLPYLILRAEERSLAYTGIRVGRFITELLLNLLFVVVLKQGVKGILYANVLAAVLNLIFVIPFQINYLKGRINKEILVDLLKFGLPMLPNGLAYLTVEVSDKYLMSRLLDKDILGAYSANYRFGSALLLIVIAFRTAWQPFFLKVANDQDAKRIYSKVLTYFSAVGVLVVVMVSYYIEYLVMIPIGPGKTIMGSEYWNGIVIIPIILTAYLFYGIYVNFTVGIYIEQKTKWMVLFTGLAAVVNVGSNLYLMPRFGMIGAAMATLLSYFVMAVTIFIANQLIYPIRYEYSRLLLLMGYLALMLFIYYQFDLSFLQRTVILVISPALLYFGGFFKKEEIVYLKSKLRR